MLRPTWTSPLSSAVPSVASTARAHPTPARRWALVAVATLEAAVVHRATAVSKHATVHAVHQARPAYPACRESRAHVVTTDVLVHQAFLSPTTAVTTDAFSAQWDRLDHR